MADYSLDRQDEDLALLLNAWPDIEEALLEGKSDEYSYDRERRERLAEAVRKAFRVEIQTDSDGLLDAMHYVLLFDVSDYSARQAAAVLHDDGSGLHRLVRRHAQAQGHVRGVEPQIVPPGKPVRGHVCPRVMASPPEVADLRDLPVPEPLGKDTEYVERGPHKLTKIEAPFYDVLRETDLVFAVQPFVQGDRTYRPDFIVYYGGKSLVVELDGHEGHKTQQQRNYDSERERWFKRKGLSTIRWTGSQVKANPQSCVKELLDVLRQGEARP